MRIVNVIFGLIIILSVLILINLRSFIIPAEIILNDYGKVSLFVVYLVYGLMIIILLKYAWSKITNSVNKVVTSEVTNTVNNRYKNDNHEEKKQIKPDQKDIADTDTDTAIVGSINEDKLYEQALDELEKDTKVKAIWAKALAESDGDEKKAKAFYIKDRVKTQKAQKEIIRLEKVRIKLAAEKIEGQLSDYLVTNNLSFIEKITDHKVKANMNDGIYDAYLEYDGSEWKISEWKLS